MAPVGAAAGRRRARPAGGGRILRGVVAYVFPAVGRGVAAGRWARRAVLTASVVTLAGRAILPAPVIPLARRAVWPSPTIPLAGRAIWPIPAIPLPCRAVLRPSAHSFALRGAIRAAVFLFVKGFFGDAEGVDGGGHSAVEHHLGDDFGDFLRGYADVQGAGDVALNHLRAVAQDGQGGDGA